MKNIFLPFFAIALLLFSCHKEPHYLTEADYLIIGYSNFSWGHYCETYKITPDAVYADSSSCAGDLNVPLADDKFQHVKYLLQQIPRSLLEEEKTDFPCGGCYDGGAYSVEFQQDGKIYRFSIADHADDMPDYLIKFTARLENILSELR